MKEPTKNCKEAQSKNDAEIEIRGGRYGFRYKEKIFLVFRKRTEEKTEKRNVRVSRRVLLGLWFP
ncbi:unnamed protein product [Sphenostylis stenocarpa]|uniref:Uncharacterized protein n=1 Tax=Sphenostylis stenocarpa TaxID=92480 RepID=A0AA86VL04_9FABA|nr:unnamed protein product [Sphenostylis stenocarpa]